jgi:hypothetical protein
MRLGQTLTIGRLVVERQTGASVSQVESVEMLVFITPRLLHGNINPQASSIIPTANADDTGTVVPADESVFGPTVPVLKRRPVRK